MKKTLLPLALISLTSFGGEYLVRLKNNKIDKANFFKSIGATYEKTLRTPNKDIHLIEINQKNLADLKSNPEIDHIEENYKIQLDTFEDPITQNFEAPLAPNTYVPNDPLWIQMWNLRNTGSNQPGGGATVKGADINAIKAWAEQRGAPSVKVAVIDTGIDYNHPDLKENMWINQKEANGRSGVDHDGKGYVEEIYPWNPLCRNNWGPS